MPPKRPPTPQKKKTEKPVVEEEDEESDEEEPTLEKQFVLFVQFRDSKNPGTHILLSQSDYWMKHAGVIQGRKLTTTDTGLCYFKFKKYKLSYEEYMEFLQNLANYKKINVDEIVEKLVNCGPPPQETNVNLGPPR